MTTHQNDTILWQLVQQNDRVAYEMLYNRYVDIIFVTIHKRIRHKTDAEDLTQDVFLSIWEKRANIALEGRFFSYLYRAAQNRTLNYLRDKPWSVEYMTAWENLSEGAEAPVVEPAIFKNALSQKTEALLEEEIMRLPERIRQVYELRYEQKMTTAEISQRLAISPHTVNNHLKAIRKRFTNAVKQASLSFFDILLLLAATLALLQYYQNVNSPF